MKYQVGIKIYNSFEIEANSEEKAEEKVRELDVYQTLNDCDFNITYVDKMNNLMPGESPRRQWFALDAGDLTAVGDCGDFETADEIATDLGMETNWLVSPDMAQQWANALASRGITAENNDE